MVLKKVTMNSRGRIYVIEDGENLFEDLTNLSDMFPNDSDVFSVNDRMAKFVYEGESVSALTSGKYHCFQYGNMNNYRVPLLLSY